jgi:exodeoxyribonuclease III
VLSVLTVNIGAASRERTEHLLDWLASRPEQLFLLTETSAGTGTAHLLEQFRRAGWAVVNTPDDGDRGAALVSRIPVVEEQPVPLGKVSIPGRVAAAILDTHPQVCVAGVYVPSRDRSEAKTRRKATFIESLPDALTGLPAHHLEHLVLGGDYNVIARTHQPLHPGFLPFEFGLLETLHARGLAGAHELCHPGTQVYSWVGRAQPGFRYDYFHVGRHLADRIGECAYLQETRESKLTDHAAVTVSLRVRRHRPGDRGPSRVRRHRPVLGRGQRGSHQRVVGVGGAPQSHPEGPGEHVEVRLGGGAALVHAKNLLDLQEQPGVLDVIDAQRHPCQDRGPPGLHDPHRRPEPHLHDRRMHLVPVGDLGLMLQARQLVGQRCLNREQVPTALGAEPRKRRPDLGLPVLPAPVAHTPDRPGGLRPTTPPHA